MTKQEALRRLESLRLAYESLPDDARICSGMGDLREIHVDDVRTISGDLAREPRPHSIEYPIQLSFMVHGVKVFSLHEVRNTVTETAEII